MPLAARRDRETIARSDDHSALRNWLRLLTCTQLIERVVRTRLREQFGTTLPRFDLLSQLHRAPDGLRMGELSARILVTNGNVTWLVAALEAEGLVKRRTSPDDRRAIVVRLTAAGKRHFETMARAHERLIIDLFESLAPAERRAIHSALGTLKQRIRRPQDAK